MKVKIKRLSESAQLPTKAHKSDAGFDLYCSRVEVDNKGNYVCHTDVALEIPKGYVGLVFPRSSIANKHQALTNSVGVIDSGYRGEITLKFKCNLPIFEDRANNEIVEICNYYRTYKDDEIYYHAGERCGQLIIMPYPEIEFEEADKLSETDRGNGGYGSTGK